MTTNYSTDELKEIARISDEQHIGLLTNCGTNRDTARKIISMSDDELRQGIAAVEGRPNKTDAQDGLIAAARRELAIRQ